ncbi:MAG TPA: hypothetical protein PK566_18795 [Pseudobacteroides sp.]|jgi:hypothetical protein|nr:hypothetical protein [Pseudobacteroides sp.]
MKKNLLFIVILALFNGCTGFFCGKIDDEHQKMIDSVNAIYYKSFEVKNIPCEQIYLNLYLKTEFLDSSKVNAAHKVLYNHELNKGWQTINIYSKDNEYLTSHSWRGNFYKESDN